MKNTEFVGMPFDIIVSVSILESIYDIIFPGWSKVEVFNPFCAPTPLFV